jgi:hypothetical protein
MTTQLLRGNTPFYGVDIGILLLDVTFACPPGDVRWATTFSFPVLYEVVPHATPALVVEGAAAGLLDAFVQGAQHLVTRGVRGIATSCGFLAIYQRELAAAVSVPVASSSLLQIPLVLRTLAPQKRLGVLTFDSDSLDERHFTGVGITSEERQRLSIFGLQHTAHFYPGIMRGLTELDVARAEKEVVEAAIEARRADPAISAFILECANLPPYAAAIQAATGCPVYDVVTLICWLHSAVHHPVW